MAEITTKAGADLVIRPASFKDAMALKNAVLKEIAGGDLDLGANIGGAEDIVKVFAKVDSSEGVQKALMKCLERCTYDKARITEQLFDDNHKAREDYYEIIIACAKENLSPFFKNLLTGLSSIQAIIPESLKQK